MTLERGRFSSCKGVVEVEVTQEIEGARTGTGAVPGPLPGPLLGPVPRPGPGPGTIS